jgi:hypothetical protein
MQQKIVQQVEFVILSSKNRDASMDAEELRKFLRYFEFTLSAENSAATSAEYKRAAWRRFMQEAATQKVLFDLKNCGAYYSLQREFLGALSAPVSLRPTDTFSSSMEQLSFALEKSKSA